MHFFRWRPEREEEEKKLGRKLYFDPMEAITIAYKGQVLIAVFTLFHLIPSEPLKDKVCQSYGKFRPLRNRLFETNPP